ncbi:unnamed protein product [Rhizophagus irregularis]|nr:unnamed protein product [Rhizophagus irregularis]
MSVASIKSDENFLKEFLRDFYQKIIVICDYLVTFENTLNEWIKNIGKDTKTILELMQNHEKCELWFSGILGFFYQCGIGCDHVDKTKALELYSLAVSNKETLYQKFTTNLHLLEENNEECCDTLQIFNFIIGKYLLSLLYYKDIILDKINLSKLEYSESARKGDPIAQYNLGYCYQYGKRVAKDYNKAFIWYSKSANNDYALGQNNLGECYEKGIGTDKDYEKAFECSA